METSEKLITENLDVWTSAVKTRSSAGRGSSKKRELYGIRRLRELILELAVCGFLVPQDSADEPASELLNQYAKAKTKLIKDAEIKKPKPVPPLERNSQSEVPEGWAEAQLTNIALVDMGNSPPGSTYNETGDGVPLINGPVEFSRGHFGKTIKAKYTTAPNVVCDEGDILVCVRGATTGRTNIADFPACIGRGVARVQALGSQEFVNLLMWENQNKLLAKGTGTTFPSISYKDLAGHSLLLPPLAEQHRIVAKVDELMALCDQLEQEQESSIAAHDTLVATLLNALTETTAFAEAWERIQANFDTLFTTESSIDQLKQTILQLAVMGKLVEQDPEDEPAAELLDRIAAEKAKLIKEKKIKKQKALAAITQEEEPYTVPERWKWCRLGDVSLSSDSGWSPQCDPQPRDNEEQWGVLKVSAVSWGLFRPDEHKKLPAGKEARPEAEVKSGDFLLSRANTEELVARGVIVGQTPPKLMMSDKIVRFLISDHTLKEFVNLVNASSSSREHYIGNSSGTSSSMKNVSRETMSNLPIPLPPLAEQHRIVAKVDELMALCDQLKASLATAQATQLNLADSLVEQAVT
ncbi:restriction endonuclease subunit S [bacterium]|nr:restriction endonuclease subunit S [Akkermansiaceae bacterium]MDB4569312.1 restriction endonuclease subunit S [bacterium]